MNLKSVVPTIEENEYAWTAAYRIIVGDGGNSEHVCFPASSWRQ